MLTGDTLNGNAWKGYDFQNLNIPQGYGVPVVVWDGNAAYMAKGYSYKMPELKID